MTKYINNFTPYQLDQFEAFFKKSMKEKLMSFYSYLTYHNNTNQKIKMSIDELTGRWNNKHKKKARKEKCICRATMYNWIKKLESAKLIKIYSDLEDTFVYNLILSEKFLDKELDKKLDNEKPLETLDNTTEEHIESCDNTLSLELSLDLDSNSSATHSTQTEYNFNKKEYIENLEKNCEWDTICKMMIDAFKLLKVKSEWIKSRVIEKISKYHQNITKKHAMSYICACIEDARKLYYANYDKYVKNEYIASLPSNFNNFNQRDNYNFENMKKMLTGEMEYNTEFLYD